MYQFLTVKCYSHKELSHLCLLSCLVLSYFVLFCFVLSCFVLYILKCLLSLICCVLDSFQSELSAPTSPTGNTLTLCAPSFSIAQTITRISRTALSVPDIMLSQPTVTSSRTWIAVTGVSDEVYGLQLQKFVE